ncbi:MAG: phosphoribosylaminoimidazolesuccinocarboxamide synthase [Candidatus Pacebacteria bacterium]|nr:phosphoribosylaminoimidazolesuccinocarboxamide synthase [Candidatus Paceibacterota bacterium]
MNILEKTDFKNLGEKYVGKVRDVYTQDDKVILISTDRYSAFDRNLALIPCKGQVLTQVSRFWFENTKDIVKNHVIDFPDPNVVVGKKCKVFPVEVVPRAFITGVTGTSLWTLYQRGQRDFGDFVLPDGMKKNQRLDKVVLTPTTKHEEHDRPLSSRDIIDGGYMTKEQWEKIADISLKLFKRGEEIALAHGLILVDTKYEFGLDENNEIVLVDEIHTPDSSRYWQANSYQGKIDQGLEPENFDKEFLRLWFKNNSDPYKDKILPEAPIEMVKELSSRYIRICEQITGIPFKVEIGDIAKRIASNLKKYEIKNEI